MSITVQTVPEIVLLDIDPVKCFEDYKAGDYKSIRLPNIKGKINFCDSNVMKIIHSTNVEDSSYSHHGKSGVENLFITTGHKQFTTVHTDRKHLIGGKCRTCMMKYDDRVMLGIPYKITSTFRDGTYVPIFWCHGSFCSFECALYHVILIGANCGSTNIHSGSLETNLRSMFKLVYPEEKMLTPSNDPYLIEDNGGSITLEQWKDKDYIFRETGNCMMLPIKTILHHI